MKTLYWIGAELKVQLVMDGQCFDVQPNSAVEVRDEVAPRMIESGNWTDTKPTAAEEPEEPEPLAA